MPASLCFCGHDCARCVTYLATVRKDDALRLRSQRFYRETFGLELPLSTLHCLGGRTDKRLSLTQSCPFRQCAIRRQLDRCADCPDYPCSPLADYITHYVNRCHQLSGEVEYE